MQRFAIFHLNILRIFPDFLLRSLDNASAGKLEIPNFLDFSSERLCF